MKWLNDWKQSITVWVAAGCLTLLAYGWMTRPFRYERFSTTSFGFDKRTGQFYETQRKKDLDAQEAAKKRIAEDTKTTAGRPQAWDEWKKDKVVVHRDRVQQSMPAAGDSY